MSPKLSIAALVGALALAGHADAAKPKPAPAEPAPAPKSEAPGAQPKPIFDLPYLQRELDNGLKVIVVKTPQKGVVSLQIPVQVGSRNEVEPGKTGFAHFFEHMMFRGTDAYPAEKYGALVKSMGADTNASTNDDSTQYYANITPPDLEKMLELEADRFQHLKYTEEQFRTEALAVKGEYLKNFSNPIQKGEERLLDLAYTTHPYKHTTMGFYADIENMPNQMEYAHQFFDRWYKPQNVAVIVVGDVDPEPTFALVKKYWSGWKRGDYKVEIPAEPPQKQAKYEHVKWDAPTLPWILSGWHAPAFEADKTDQAALAVLGEIYFGETSDLYQKLVVKDQLVDEFGFEAPRERDPGLFLVYARLTKPENAAAVNHAISDAMARARTERVDAAQLAAVKSHLKYAFASGMSSAATIGSILSRYVRYERDVETLNRYYRSFDRVGVDDLVAIANRVFVDANRTTISIANSDALAGANDYRPLDAEVAKATPSASTSGASGDSNKPKTPKEVFAERDRASTVANKRDWDVKVARTTVQLVEQPSDSPLIDVSLIFRSGAAYDPPGKKGLAQLTASMLTEGGSSKHPIEEIQKALYPLAAGIGDQVDKEAVRFSGQVHRDNFDRWIEIVGEQLTDPGFRAEDFERLKRQQLNAIRTGLRSNNDEEFAKEALYERVYGKDHPYGTLTLGHAKDLESITIEDVKTFYYEQFRRKRLTVGLAGGYDERIADSVLAATMGFALEEHPEAAVVKVATPKPAKTRGATVIQKQTSSVAVSFGVPIELKRGDADWTALWLMRAWLGEHRNSNGRLYDRIREQRGMNYGDYAYIEYFPAGMFRMQPEPNHPRQNDLFQVWLRPLRSNNDAMFATRVALFELDKLVRDGMTQEAFESTKNYLMKNVAILTAHQTRQLGYAMDASWYGTPAFVEYVRGALEKLTREQVNAAIKRHVKLDALQFVMISKDAKGLAAALAADTPSPVTYNTTKPAALTDEDKVIAKLPLKLGGKGAVSVVQDTQMFE